LIDRSGSSQQLHESVSLPRGIGSDNKDHAVLHAISCESILHSLSIFFFTLFCACDFSFIFCFFYLIFFWKAKKKYLFSKKRIQHTKRHSFLLIMSRTFSDLLSTFNRDSALAWFTGIFAGGYAMKPHASLTERVMFGGLAVCCCWNIWARYELQKIKNEIKKSKE
jgi:hypothetical protein